MKIIKFSDYKFPYNPEVFSITYEKRYSQIPIPFQKDLVQSLGVKNKVISGEGEFFGDSVLDEFKKLETLFLNSNVGILTLPSGENINAFFTKLSMVGEGGNKIIRYSFEFKEISDGFLDYSKLVIK